MRRLMALEPVATVLVFPKPRGLWSFQAKFHKIQGYPGLFLDIQEALQLSSFCTWKLQTGHTMS
jgi:hypothetical protein